LHGGTAGRDDYRRRDTVAIGRFLIERRRNDPKVGAEEHAPSY
jgi:hypothetical protein